MNLLAFTISILTVVSATISAQDSRITLSRPVASADGLFVTLTNSSHSAVSAYLIRARFSDGTRVRVESHPLMDIYVKAGTDRPIPPGENRSIRIGLPD